MAPQMYAGSTESIMNIIDYMAKDIKVHMELRLLFS